MKIIEVFNNVGIKGTIISLLVIVTYFTVFGYYRSVICILWKLTLLIFKVYDTIIEKTKKKSLPLFFRVKYNFMTVLIQMSLRSA
jgi:hypothetical protein